jgi:hypothetical protein
MVRDTPNAPGASARSPLSDRVCDAAVLGFGLWTLCCHAVVFAGGSLHALLTLYALSAAGLIALWLWARGRYGAPLASPRHLEPEHRSLLPDRALDRIQLAGLALAAAAALACYGFGGALALWIAAVGLLGLAAVPLLLLRPARLCPPAASRTAEGLLWSLAAGCVLATAIVHRPDLDDAFYVNLAVAAADAPAAGLLLGDTMHGIPDLPLTLPVYRVHSFELGNAALAWLLGLPAIYCFHFVSAWLAAVLVPLAHARLYRLLLPRVWLWGVAALLVVLLGVGDVHRWYGNFAFVRLWQGKGIALFVFLPLIYAYAIAFALRPSRRLWLLLAAAQIGAVGCTSSALWAAPGSALLGLACALPPSRRGLRLLGVGALSSLYVIAIGALLQGQLQTLVAPDPTPEAARAARLAAALVTVLGDGRLLLFAMFALMGAWACAARDLAQRFAIALPLGVLLVLLNPFLDEWVSRNLTGPAYWRSLWALPLPTLISLVLIAPLQLERGPRSRIAARVATVSGLLAFVAFVPRIAALSPHNVGNLDVGMRIGRPGLKVPEPGYALALRLHQSVPSGSRVIAPPEVGPWLPTLHSPVYPLEVRSAYLDAIEGLLDERELLARRALTGWVGNEPADDVDLSPLLASALEHFEIAGVCLRDSNRAPSTRALLERSGFARTFRQGDHEIWVRQ